MSKTIEEAERRVYSELELRQAINDCRTAFMSKPLASRLTDEEKERVRKIYKGELEFAQFYQRKANSCRNQQCKMDYEASRDIAKSRANMLESIFGKEFFKEEE